MSELSWEDKLHSLQELMPWKPPVVAMLRPGAWYVASDARIQCGAEGITVGHTESPQRAVEAFWEAATMPGNHLVLRPLHAREFKRYQWVGDDWYEFRLTKPRQAKKPEKSNTTAG